jgi:putative transposase
MRNHHVSHDSSNRHAYLSQFRRRSLCLPDHDYSAPSIYHIVTCAKGIERREPLFKHPVLRQLLQTNWLDLPQRFPSIQLDEFVIMPDHIHFLIWVNKWPERLEGNRAPYLSEIMQAYKSKVAVEWIRYVNKNHPTWSAKIWQKKYYERILRIEELERTRLYIRENPDHEGEGWQHLYDRMEWERPF